MHRAALAGSAAGFPVGVLGGRRRISYRLRLCGGLLGANRAEGECEDVTQQLDLLGDDGPLAADAAGEGQPPGEQRPEAVAGAGQECDVDEQPYPSTSPGSRLAAGPG
jgi:hypothetical protein